MTIYKSVLCIIADDWSRIAGCYGNNKVKTPRIDSFAEKSVVFDHAFCTSPSCAVSRACILTGHHSHTHGQYGHCHGIHGFRTSESMTSTPQALRIAGFATACIGKKHVEPFSVYPFEFEPKINPRNPNEITRAARAFLSANIDKPFYLHVGFSDPHRSSDGFGNNPSFCKVPKVTYKEEDVEVPGFLPDIPEVRTDLAAYYEAISRFDFGVGQLLDLLKEMGRADDTMIILTTDHAMPFPGAKASFFDSGHHCPLIIQSPDLCEKGSHHQALVNWTNLRPTVQDWCGVPIPQNLPERSIVPILNNSNAKGWDQTFFSHCFHEIVNYNPYRVLRGRRYKFVHNLSSGTDYILPTDLFRSPSWSAMCSNEEETFGERSKKHFFDRSPEELYDIINDPFETKNLISDPNLEKVADHMRIELVEFRQRTNDPWLEIDHQEKLI